MASARRPVLCTRRLSACQRVGSQLEFYDFARRTFPTFEVEGRPGTVGRPETLSLPAGVGVINPAVHPLGVEPERIGNPENDPFPILQGEQPFRPVARVDGYVFTQAQRVKLAAELARPDTGQTLYLLDEPTTGLHWVDAQRLLDLLFRLRDAGNTIIVIEHNMDFIRCADWVVELGPGGGSSGGRLVHQGPVDDLLQNKDSPTGSCLAAKETKNS